MGFDSMDLEPTIETTTSEQIKDYLLGFVQNSSLMHDLARLSRAMNWQRLSTNIADPHDWVRTYCAKDFGWLDAFRYTKFETEDPRYSIGLLIGLL